MTAATTESSVLQSKVNAKFMIFITFESRDKTCSKIEKTWFLLVKWVAKRNSLVNEKNPVAIVQRCSVKKGS